MFQRVSKQLLRHETLLQIKRYYAYKIVRIQPLQRKTNKIEDISAENQGEAIKNAVYPLWNVPYSEQLELKNEWISYVISQYYSILDGHLKNNAKAKRRLSLPSRPRVENICPSPIIHEYRNKETYMVRTGVDGNPKTVGWIAGNTSGQYVCVPPVQGIAAPQHIKFAKAFQDYIRLSDLPACHNFSEGGHWTQVQVRSNQDGDVMALIKIHPQQLTQVEIEDECKNITEYFTNGPGSNCKLSSLYFQSSPYTNASGRLAPYQLLFGEKYLMEKISGCVFALSPASFVQCNIKMAEIMYDKIFTAAKLSPETSVLDLGCGIGTISILATPFVRGTVGIDMCEEAIQDAKSNAGLNNIHSANFIAGTIESKLKSALKWLQPSSDVVAILNPGRCGVETSVLRALRSTPQIRTVIYVACEPNHEWVIRNVLAIIRPEGKKCQAPPFKFKSVIPVDMFPLTTHAELIMKFSRSS